MAVIHRDEQHEMADVVMRLTNAYGRGMAEEEIGETVGRIHRGFAGSKIRDYIPLLVENAARRELTARAGGGAVTDARRTDPPAVRIGVHRRPL
jgi:hypothetical protein